MNRINTFCHVHVNQCHSGCPYREGPVQVKSGQEAPAFAVVRLTAKGVDRVLEGEVGMTFIVDKFTDTVDRRGQMAHVRDYQFKGDHYDWQIWSLGPEGYEVVYQRAELPAMLDAPRMAWEMWHS